MKLYNKFKILNQGGDDVSFDFSKLRGKIIEKCGTMYKFAEIMGWSERTMSLKINGKRAWTQLEIAKAVDILGLEQKDIPVYFFVCKVQNIEQNTGIR